MVSNQGSVVDERHQRRIKLVQDLFAYSFGSPDEALAKSGKQKDFALGPILPHLEEIDRTIEKYAPRYPIDKIAKIDLAILRLSLYEIMFEKKNPLKVLIDEAIILAKEFGTEKSYAFVNGVLGSLLKDKDQKDTD